MGVYKESEYMKVLCRYVLCRHVYFKLLQLVCCVLVEYLGRDGYKL